MPSQTETLHDGGFVLSLANRNRSLENVLIESGQDLEAGTVLGKNADNRYVAHDATNTDGSDVAVGILYANVNTSSTGTNAHTEATMVARDAEVNENEITWADGRGPTNADANAKTALEALGIRFR